MLNPARMIRLRRKWRITVHASSTLPVRANQMIPAEVEAATVIAAVGCVAAYVADASVYLLVAVWMITVGRHAIADVTLP